MARKHTAAKPTETINAQLRLHQRAREIQAYGPERIAARTVVDFRVARYSGTS